MKSRNIRGHVTAQAVPEWRQQDVLRSLSLGEAQSLVGLTTVTDMHGGATASPIAGSMPERNELCSTISI